VLWSIVWCISGSRLFKNHSKWQKIARRIGRVAAREIAEETAIFRKVEAEMKSNRRTALELQMVVLFRY
jgi:hypothetical protein